MADGSYIGLRRDSKEVARDTNAWIAKTLEGVPEDEQADALERALNMRAAQKQRRLANSK